MPTLETDQRSPERGATALLVASSLLLLLGMAAVAIDLGAGFNERRQNQTAADTAVLAGGLEAANFLGTNEEIVTQVLAFARENLTASYSPAEWQMLWQNCTDPDKTASFQPMPDPWTPGATLDCISRTSSFLRVRIPDQSTNASFARVLGVSNLTTKAVAVALIGPRHGGGGVLPFGIAGGVGTGEICLGQSPSGTAYPPCTGPSSGTFGTLLSEFFGEFYDAGQGLCGNPGGTEIKWGTALGVDHAIGLWDPAAPPTPGDPHPGDNAVLNADGTNRDACNSVGGEPVAIDGEPVNTVKVDTGFSNSNNIEDGLVSNETFNYTDIDGNPVASPSRLQMEGTDRAGSANSTRIVVGRRQGANETLWELDNVGPWEYLTDTAHTGVGDACKRSDYDSSLDEFQKTAKFNDCLAAWEAVSGTKPVIFDVTIQDSPRFAWAPQYWYDLPTSGLSWEPVQQYRMVFLGGTWFNCNASGSCGVIFYPDADQITELCDPNGSNCKQLSLNQLAAWVLPNAAVPTSVSGSFPGGVSPFETSLYR